jgi:CheY-like chemotaxis protein
MWPMAVGLMILGAIAAAGTAWGQEQPAEAPPAEAVVPTTQPAAAEATPAPPEAAEGAATAPAAGAVDEKALAELWDNFLHGIKVAREDLAESTGRAILETGAARQVYLLSVQTEDVQWLLTRGEGLEGLKPVIEGIRKMIEDGYNAERSDSTQIAHAIDLLDKNLRAYELGASRLVQSGEYAMPQLVQKLTDRSTSVTLTERIISVLPRIGKNAVRPLAATLAAKDQALVQIAAEALGRIRYGEAAAFLKELLERQDLVDRTREVATAALIACGGKEAATTPVASLLYDQAEKYYYNRQSVPLDPNSPTATVWTWHEGLGLGYQAVPKAIFGDIYAMRLAQAALKYDPSFHPAVSLWLAAKMRKEIATPPGQRDLTEPSGQPNARFYALAGSVEYLQDVLARALRDKDAALALRAIEALSETAGAKSLIEPIAGGVQPLVEAVGNRNLEVRLMAALALANALPQEHFKGDDRVVAVLNEALRQRGHRKALLVDADPAQRNLLQDALRSAGYEVVDQPDGDKAILTARQTGGVDLVVLGAKPDPGDFLVRMRNEPTLMALPAVVATSDERLKRLAAEDGGIVLMAGEVDAASVANAVAQAMKTASATAPTAEQTASWAVRAADVIARLGRTGNKVFDISQNATMLTSAMRDPQADVAMASARALAAMPVPQAQQALVERALTTTVEEQTRVELLKLLAGSLRRWGNLLTDAQADAIIAVVTDSKQSQPIREAAAAVLGAMNLPSEKIRSLIVGAGT